MATKGLHHLSKVCSLEVPCFLSLTHKNLFLGLEDYATFAQVPRCPLQMNLMHDYAKDDML